MTEVERSLSSRVSFVGEEEDEHVMEVEIEEMLVCREKHVVIGSTWWARGNGGGSGGGGGGSDEMEKLSRSEELWGRPVCRGGACGAVE